MVYANSDTFTKTNAQPADAGSYSVRVAFGSPSEEVISNAAVVTVAATPPPVISQQPVAQSIRVGETATFTVVASAGGAPLSYVWLKDGVGVLSILGLTSSGGTGSSFTVFSLPPSLYAGNYSVRVSSGVSGNGGSVTSNPVALTITPAAVITAQPVAQSVNVGANVSFSVTVSLLTGNQDSLSYQWRKDGADIAGATSRTLFLPNVPLSAAGAYSVSIADPTGPVISATANLVVAPFVVVPTITDQPASTQIQSGQTAVFSVGATANGPLTYLWRRTNGNIRADVVATTATLTIPNATEADAGGYYVIVSSSAGNAGSSAGFLTVSPVPSAPVFAMTFPLGAQPAGTSVIIGYNITLRWLVSGAPSPTFQWQKDGIPIPGANTDTLNLNQVQPSTAGIYTLVASNSAGTVTSAPAPISVFAITSRSIDGVVGSPSEFFLTKLVPTGADVTLAVTAIGSGLTYQWRKSGGTVIILGATGPSLTLHNVSAADADSYYVEVRSGTVAAFANFSLIVNSSQNPVIVSSPASLDLSAGSAAVFSVVASGSSPLSYQWFKEGVAIPGANNSTFTITSGQPSDQGSYYVVVTNIAGSVTSSRATLTITANAIAPTITTQPSSQSLTLGSSASFTVVATGTAPLTYQWLKNGAPVSGATATTLTLANLTVADAASYTVIVTNSAGTVTSATANLAVASASNYAGTYFGRFNNNPSDRFALVIRADGTAIFLGYAASLFTGYTATNITINADGSFTANLSELKPAAANTPAGDPSPGLSFRSAPATAPISLNGSVADGAFTGGIIGTALTVAAPKSPAVGVAQSAAGVYQTAALNSSTGGLTTIVDATGEAFVFSQTSTGVAAGTGTLNTTTGQVTAVLADNSQATATLNATSGSATATLTTSAKETLSFSGLAEGVIRTDRLVNIASRGAVSSSDLMIAGFVITGSSPKSVMIRATGPALAAFRVGGTVPNPKLELYRGTTKIQENDEWSLATNATDIIATAARTGAFPLTAASADAVLLTTLDPGGYTAQVSSVTGASGVALVEVYDASSTAVTASTPRLVNISTRANVAGGEGLLIAGIVITGNAPKKVLIRATGPALTAFGVPGALTDPLLKLYKGDNVVRQNDNWSESSSEAALITAAGSATGAFALTTGTKDAAMLITLEPGSYTAQVSGVDGATGAALVEVYEVP